MKINFNTFVCITRLLTSKIGCHEGKFPPHLEVTLQLYNLSKAFVYVRMYAMLRIAVASGGVRFFFDYDVLTVISSVRFEK